MVTIRRRHARVFSISIPEAAELVAGLLEQAPELASHRAEAR
jgi:hypothetical protein